MGKIRIAMLGCGGNSRGHARRLLRRSDEVQIVAACDVKPEIVDRYIEQNLSEVTPRPQAFTDFAELLQTVKPDAVLISTPHTLHYEQGMQALEAGCHVFMEKPMVTSAEHAYAIAEKVEQTGKIFVIGYNTPCTPAFHYLREQIRANTFGKLELVTGYISQPWRRLTTGAWRQVPELSGGGQAYDSGAHLLNSVCWSVESNVEQVFAFIDNCDTPVDVNSAITIKFENGTLAAIGISGNCENDGSHTGFIFENGRVEIDGWGGSFIRVYTKEGQIEPQLVGEAQTPDDNFIDAILGKAEPRTSPRNGIIQSELMDAIYRSAETGVPARPNRRPASASGAAS